MKFITIILLLLISFVGFSQKEYVSRVENPICSDFCSLTLTDISDKVIFFTELSDIVIFTDEGEVINPNYLNTYFIIETKVVSANDDNGSYSIEVITSIRMKK